ncbi:MAG TPA: ABC transporter permease [Plantibacter sp.]|uniref:ABC transporter permease n=1 Tax=unclassified Plantibacter TaxID=2624265 RepID=UPI002C5BA121|nr:ABC transporter permease [Plantibacter sp.]
MFGTYLRRELVGRRKQTVIIAIGMALAIALVIIVNSVAAGVKSAQAEVLESVYGVGTDITVSEAATAPTDGGGPGQDFAFGSGDGTTTDGTTTVNQATLAAGRGTTTFDATALDTITGVDNVAAAAVTLSLSNTTFTGELPDFSQNQSSGDGAAAGGTGGDAASGGTPPQGGPDGAGGSSFGVDSFTVVGLDPAGDAVGPLSAVTLSDGRTLTADDAGTDVAILDSSYATEAGIATGDTIDIASTTFTVVGTVTASGSEATTASNVYIPLDVAQTLSGLDGKISNVYVQAASSTDITQIQSDIETALPDATVSTQEDLASTVSGSLASASTLVSNLGTWLSIIVLVAAFLIAILFTISGVTRRTREFGTLKAIGWSNKRIVGQVAGESVVQSLIGGVVGVAVGLIGVLAVNLVAPTLSAASTTTSAGGGFGGSGGGGGAGSTTDAAVGAASGGAQAMAGGGFGGGGQAAATTEIVLQAPITGWIIVIAVGIAILGGLLAGAIGGWRASRLRPAEALRSVA